MSKANFKTGDTVKIISGADKGKTAKVVKMDKKNGKAILEGLKEIERHVAANRLNPRGGKHTIHLGYDLSNLKLEKAAPAPKKKATAKKKKETK